VSVDPLHSVECLWCSPGTYRDSRWRGRDPNLASVRQRGRVAQSSLYRNDKDVSKSLDATYHAFREVETLTKQFEWTDIDRSKVFCKGFRQSAIRVARARGGARTAVHFDHLLWSNHT
jgi:hypothetical protein